MRSKLLARAACFLAAVSLSLVGFAFEPPAPPVSSGGPSTEAARLLKELHQDANNLRMTADQLEMYNRDRGLTGIGWEADATALQNMKDQINKMDRITYRLRNLEKELPQAQEAEVNKIAPAMAELTDTTQAAIQYLSNNENRLMFDPYPSYAGELYSESGRVVRATAPSNQNAYPGAGSSQTSAGS
jgi:hypothetical protein